MRCALVFPILVSFVGPSALDAKALSGTQPLDWSGDLAARMVDGIHAYLDRTNADAMARRPGKIDFSLEAAAAQREKLREQLGLTRSVPERTPATPASARTVPILGRGPATSGVPGFREAKIPPREFLWRAYFELGHTLVGEEVRETLAAVDAAKRDRPDAKVAVAGTGDAAMVALLAAALDPRIDVAVVRGYFGSRQSQWQEPIDRTIFRQLPEFGDAEIAALIAPRRLIIDTSDYPQWESPPPPAAPGKLAPVAREAVEIEARRAQSLVGGEWLILSDDAATTRKLAREAVGTEGTMITVQATDDQALFLERVEETQQLMRESQQRRGEFWGKADFSNAEKFATSAAKYRDQFWQSVIGKLPPASMTANPRSRPIYETERVRGWEVVLDVFPEVFGYGILLVPKDLKPGEKRPVVVCQHGLEGRPSDLTDPKSDHPAYHAYGARLAEEGFIVFAPQNPYIGKTHFRQICRKAWPLGLSLWSFIAAQHQRILEWLGAQEFVDAARIGFYGLSYGGKTAMRIPALLDGYCLSICSADYNEWIWKNCDARAQYSYLYTVEYDMVEWNVGTTFNYAELSWLIFPRPFMVERGHDDGVSCDEWVAYEFARTFRHYSKLGLGDRAVIEFFNGPHTINGKGTFEFLRQHLGWRR